jgi:hypothetical protein
VTDLQVVVENFWIAVISRGRRESCPSIRL